MKKVSSPTPVEIITTPRSEATLTPTTTVSPSHRFPFTTSYPHSFHFIPPSSISPLSTMASSSSSTIPSTPPPLPSQVSIDPLTTVSVTDRVETTHTATAPTNSRVEMSEEEFRKKVAALLKKVSNFIRPPMWKEKAFQKIFTEPIAVHDVWDLPWIEWERRHSNCYSKGEKDIDLDYHRFKFADCIQSDISRSSIRVHTQNSYCAGEVSYLLK